MLVIALPFFVLSPSNFWHQVLVAQIDRKDTIDALSVPQRLGLILGLDNQDSSSAHTTIAVGMTVVIAVAVLSGFVVARRQLSRLAWFLLIATAATMTGLIDSQQFYDHYTYATIAPLAMLVGLVVGYLLDAVRVRLPGLPQDASRWLRRAGWGLAVVGVVAVAALVIPNDASRARTYLAGAEAVNPEIAALIPAGSCVVTDDPILLIESDRLDSNRAGCPVITDPFGMFVANGGSPPPGVPPFQSSLVQPWLSAFSRTQYVVLSVPGSDYVPFTPALIALLSKDFISLYSGPHADIHG